MTGGSYPLNNGVVRGEGREDDDGAVGVVGVVLLSLPAIYGCCIASTTKVIMCYLV